MGRREKGAAAAALALLFTALWQGGQAGATKMDVDSAQSEISSLEEEKQKVENTLEELEGLKSDAAAYVTELDASLTQLEQELDDLAGQISGKEQEIAAAGEELEAAKAAEEEQYQAMKLRIRYMYERGETSFLDLLFESESISELLNRAEYISQISSYDREKLTEYVQEKEDIAVREAALETERQELLALQESTEARQESMETLLAEKQAQLADYDSQIAGAQDQISAYEADIQAQEEKIRAIEAEMKRREEEARKQAEEAGKTYTPVSLGNISFIWPCPSSSRITSQFGGRSSPTEGASTNHKGVDIGASSGSDILAAASGTVSICTYSVSAGNYIMFDHGGGISTVYMHCSSLLVSAGEKVTQGQVIAKVGSTGYSTGPHLHFGIRADGAYVNPLQYVSP